MNNRIALITQCSFPVGGPETNRFSTYCKAFAKKGFYTKVYVLLSTENKVNPVNTESDGVFQGVEYQYLAPLVRKAGESRLRKGCIAFTSLYKLFGQLNRDQIDTMVVYWGPSLIVYSTLWLYSRILGASLLIDRGEYPSPRETLSRMRDWKERSIFKYFDGVIVMADKLVGYYDRVKSRKARLFQLPMTVDMERFEGVGKEPQTEKYMVCIFGSHGRDSVMDTVEAYALYHARYKDCSFKLWLVGNMDRMAAGERIRAYIEEQGLGDAVIVKGVLPSNLLPRILGNAEAAVTTAREYNSGGFPSKMGEYLASGTVVIATAAGELPLYLTHKVNALLAAPGDVIGIAENMSYLHEEPEECISIGRKGFATADRHFNVYTYLGGLLRFIEELSRRKSPKSCVR